jgi:hypothetical protein
MADIKRKTLGKTLKPAEISKNHNFLEKITDCGAIFYDFQYVWESFLSKVATLPTYKNMTLIFFS